MKIHLTQKRRRQISITSFLVILLLIGIATYATFDKKNNEFKTVNDPKKAQQAALTLKEIVGKIYVLPDENPTVATITDESVLPNDPFYQNAKNGDKLLIFSNAQKIVLYRPGINKVVDVGAVEPAKEASQPDVAGTSTTQEATSASEIKTIPKVLYDTDPQE